LHERQLRTRSPTDPKVGLIHDPTWLLSLRDIHVDLKLGFGN